jgi:Na+/H+ antiporter NhaD/arsenite permease-like protein
VTIAIVTVFALVYVGMILGGFPGLKLDRAGIALLGAIAILSLGAMTPKAAWDSVDYSTIGLLFGLMILSAQFAMSGLYDAFSNVLVNLRVGTGTLLALLIATSGILGALLTNDVVAVAMAPVLLHISKRRGLNPIPFLLALACSTNAGSTATIIGSPQNILIGQNLHLSFTRFLYEAGVPALISLGVIWAVIAISYRGKWDLDKGLSQTRPKGEPFDRWEMIKGIMVAVGIIVAFVFTEWPRELVALGAGGLLLMNGRFRSKQMLDYEDWQLLVLFIGLFIVNAAFQQTHLPQKWISDVKVHGIDLQSTPWLFALTAILSDVVSNVPSVMLLIPFADSHMAGPAMALASGLSSNLIIIGSLANIIVVDAAGQQGLKISFAEHARVGIPVTLISLGVAACWLWLLAQGWV